MTVKRILAALAAFLVLVPSVPGRAGAPERKLTLMIYMCGSSLEYDYGSASKDLEEIEAACARNPELNVMVLLGGAPFWRRGYSTERLTLLQIGPRGTRLLAELPQGNMGARETLAMMLREGTERFPADRYALVLWNHGAGPVEGVCRDDLFGEDYLSLPELAGALADAALPGKLGWIGFDACLMGSLEVGLAVAPYADYMIASEETEPKIGWDYSFLAGIRADTPGGEAGRMIVDSYMAQPSDEMFIRTMACLDLREAETLRQAAEALFAELTFQLDSDTYSWFSNARRSAAEIASESNDYRYDLADLADLARQFAEKAPEQAAALQEAVRRAVYSGDSTDRGCGLSIYAPLYNRAEFQSGWREAYAGLDLLPAYARYVDRFAGIWLGKQLADWRLDVFGAEPPGAGSQGVFLDLTDEQLTHFASARAVILRETGGTDTFQKIYEISGVTPEGHTLRADYRYDGLYILDGNGEPITDSYPFSEEDGWWYLTAMLETESMADLVYTAAAGLPAPEGSRSRTVRLVFRESETPGELRLANIVPYGEDGQLRPGRQDLEFNRDLWSWLYFIDSSLPLRAARDGEGRLLPVSQWEQVVEKDFRARGQADETGRVLPYREVLERLAAPEENIGRLHMWGEVRLDEPWTARVLPEQKSGLNLFAQFIVTDTQGNEFATELIPLENPAAVSSASFSEPVITEPSVRVTLARAEINSAELDAGLALRFRAENDTIRTYRLALRLPAVNGTAVPEAFSSFQEIPPRSEADVYILLPAGSLPPLPDGTVRTVSFVPELTDQGNGKRITGERITVSPALSAAGVPGVREAWEYEGAEALGEAEAGGLLFRIVRLEENGDGSLSGTLHLANRSGQDRRLSFTPGGRETLPSAVVNGCLLANCMQLFSEAELPDGSGLYTDFTVRRAPAADDFSPEGETPDLFAWWGVRDVASVGFLFSLPGGAEGAEAPVLWADVPLRSPLRTAYAAPAAAAPQPLFTADGAEILLRGAGKNLTTLRILMDARNTGSADAVLAAAECRINGTDVKAALRTELPGGSGPAAAIPAGMSVRVLAALTVPWSLMNQPLETAEMLLVVQGGDGAPAARRVSVNLGD